MKNFLLFLAFLATGILIYIPVLHVVVPSDNYWLFYTFDVHGMKAMPDFFLNVAPFLFSTSVIYFLYLFIGKCFWAWILVSASMHAANAFMVYKIAGETGENFLPNNKNLFAIFSAVIFLVSPYQTETVVWSPINLCLQLSTFFAFSGIFMFLQYLKFRKTLPLILLNVSFLLAVFSKENTMAAPLICLAIWCFYRWNTIPVLPGKKLFWIFVPQAVIILLYFSMTRLLTGHWLYNAGMVELPSDPMAYTGNFIKYLAKFILFYRYLPNEFIDPVLRHFYQDRLILTLIVISVAAILALLIYFMVKKAGSPSFYAGAKRSVYFVMLFFCFVFSLLPVLPLDSSFLGGIYPDRYGYFPSAFFYMFLCGCFILWSNKWNWILPAAYAILCLVLLKPTFEVWTEVDSYCSQIIQSFRPYSVHQNIYILNVPAYYKGASAFRTDFPEAVFCRYGNDPGKINVIAETYQDNPYEPLMVKKYGNVIEVSAPPGNAVYFSRHCGWAKSYVTKDYDVVFDGPKRSYALNFTRDIKSDDVFIYWSGDKWNKLQ